MGKIRDRMNPWILKTQGPHGLDLALRYVESADPHDLAAIQQSTVRGGWLTYLRMEMNLPPRLEDEDRRTLHVLAAKHDYPNLHYWLSKAMAVESPAEDYLGTLRGELKRVGLPDDEIAPTLIAYLGDFQTQGRLNSAARYVLALTDQQLAQIVKSARISPHQSHLGNAAFLGLVELLFAVAPDRLDVIAPLILEPSRLSAEMSELMLRKGGKRFEPQIAASWKSVPDEWTRYCIAKALVAHDPERYKDEALSLCRELLEPAKNQRVNGGEICDWLASTYGAEARDDICRYLERPDAPPYLLGMALNAASKSLGKSAIPVMLVAARNADPNLRRAAFTHLIKLDDGSLSPEIKSGLEAGIDEAMKAENEYQPGKSLVEWINMAAKWQPNQLVEKLWPLSEHKSKRVRDASARALGRMGDEIVPRAIPLLTHKKADRRSWVVTLLLTAGSPAALSAFESRLDEEPDDEVRDAMLLALDAARAASGREFTRAEVADRVARAAKKIEQPPAAWLDESRLPPLRYADGTPLGGETTRFLLYRQARAREMRPDVEARPLYAMIDRANSGDFALELLKLFAATKADAADRWVLAVTGLLGDDRVVPTLNSLIQQWGDSARGKMAEYGVQALALLGTDTALTTVDALALRYRVKNKNIGAAAVAAFAEAAERRGISTDELGDLVVPWLGFAPGKPRIVEAGGKRFQVAVSSEWKLVYRDLEKNKPVSSLPKSAPKEILATIKDEAAILKDVTKGQKARIENLMVRQHRWPVARWRALFLDHPLLFPFAARLVWGAYDQDHKLVGTFRALEDRSLTTPADEAFTLEGVASIGITHPLELDEAARSAWRTHLADYEIKTPFPQLDRPVVAVKDNERSQKMCRDYDGTSLNAMTFRSRAEKLGWARGSVTDAGGVDAYRKVFPGAGVEAFLGLDGMFVGIGMNDTIQLQNLLFVRAGTVKIGSYVYDTPSDEADPRLIPFGEVPPVVFSEVMGDLARISGKQAGDSEQTQA